MPLVSVLMPVYNAELYLREAVESILTQTFRDFEFLIIDDGSTDRSRSILESYAARDSRIHFASRPNTGYVVALNEMLDMAEGQYLARMDADDISLRTRLEDQVSCLDSQRGCVLVGSNFEFIDPDGRPLCQVRCPQSHAEIESALLRGDAYSILHPACLMRSHEVRAVGGYRNDLKIAEDIDLFLRLAEIGGLCNILRVLLRYRVHQGSVTHQDRKAAREIANRVIQEARFRRGMEPITPHGFDTDRQEDRDVLRRWGWWALNGRNVATARRYALRSVMQSPCELESWRLLACSLRGH